MKTQKITTTKSSFQKITSWLLSWVYDATDGQIYTGHDHINIIPEIPNGMEKAMEGKIICGWYNDDGSSVYPSIATDTVSKDLASYNSPIAKEAQKAAMKYWERESLGGEYYLDSVEYCPHCDTDYDPEYENHEADKCYQCGEWYHPCDMYEDENHSMPYCPECNEHVVDLEDHNRDYHYEPEPGMPTEGSTIQYDGREWMVMNVSYDGMTVTPLLPGGVTSPYYKSWILTWDDYKKYLEKQKGYEIHPNQLDFSSINPYLWQPYFLDQKSTTSMVHHYVDLHDREVFAKLCKDYISLQPKLADEFNLGESANQASDSLQRFHDAMDAEMGGYNKNNWVDWDDFVNEPKGEDIYQGLVNEPNTEMDFTPTQSDDTPSADISQPDNPAVISIARDWDSQEYRWSYDGTQLHMWRVFNRSAYGPSHFDMFGHEGYENHSQGRVYVSELGKVGVLYWQITHPECERVLNEWCLKTFGKLPDYTYRAYGPYQGKPVSRWDFPIVEVGGLPIHQNERWWEMPGGYPGMRLNPLKKDYPAKKSEKSLVPGPVDDQGQPVTPGKNKRRKRTRNRKYRNRSFRR